MKASCSSEAPQSNDSSLTCTQVLTPPLKTIGSGSSALKYSSQSPAWHIAFSRNGEWLAACFGAPDPCIRMWKLSGEEYVLHSTLSGIHQRTIRSISFCPMGLVLAAASFDATVSLWEFTKANNEWECTTQLEGHENEVKCVAWNATGSLLGSCGRDKTVWLWETFIDGSIGGSMDNELECIAVLNGHEADVKCMVFAPSHGQWGDGDEILVTSGYDDTIKVWAEDAGDWYCASSLPNIHTDTIWSIAMSPGGGRMVSAAADGSLSILKSYTSKEKKELFPEEEGEQ
jgi:WD40 repeat protein